MQHKVLDLCNTTSLEVTCQIQVFRHYMYSGYATHLEENLLATLQRICSFLILPVKPTTLVSIFDPLLSSPSLMPTKIYLNCWYYSGVKPKQLSAESGCASPTVWDSGSKIPKRNRCKTPPKTTSEAFMGTWKRLCFKSRMFLPSKTCAIHSGGWESLLVFSRVLSQPHIPGGSHGLGAPLPPQQYFTAMLRKKRETRGKSRNNLARR